MTYEEAYAKAEQMIAHAPCKQRDGRIFVVIADCEFLAEGFAKYYASSMVREAMAEDKYCRCPACKKYYWYERYRFYDKVPCHFCGEIFEPSEYTEEELTQMQRGREKLMDDVAQWLRNDLSWVAEHRDRKLCDSDASSPCEQLRI